MNEEEASEYIFGYIKSSDGGIVDTALLKLITHSHFANVWNHLAVYPFMEHNLRYNEIVIHAHKFFEKPLQNFYFSGVIQVDEG